jgi:hypothetical protein
MVASTRIRCLQIIKGLLLEDQDVGLFSLQDPAPHVLVLGKRYDKDSVDHALELRERHGTRLALDLCDNHFYANEDEPRWRARAADLRRAVGEADLVIASTPALAEVIRQETSMDAPIQIIGDPIDNAMPTRRLTLVERWHTVRLKRFLARRGIVSSRRLLWFGNHGASYASGGMQDLLRIEEALHQHHRCEPLSLTVVSNSEEAFRQHLRQWTLPRIYLPWSPNVFSLALAHHAIAVIPAQLNPFTRCKTPNRLVTAFYNRLAVAADRIPSYEEFDGLAVLDDWDSGLGRLMADSLDRGRRIEAARRHLLEHHDLRSICRAWRTAFDRLLEHPPSANNLTQG